MGSTTIPFTTRNARFGRGRAIVATLLLAAFALADVT